MDTFIAFSMAWICTITGVALGGYLVFRTKREPHEGFFQVQPEAGEAFNLTEDSGGFPADDIPIKSSAKIPDPVQRQNDAFVQQFADSLADKAEAENISTLKDATDGRR